MTGACSSAGAMPGEGGCSATEGCRRWSVEEGQASTCVGPPFDQPPTTTPWGFRVGARVVAGTRRPWRVTCRSSGEQEPSGGRQRPIEQKAHPAWCAL